MKAIISRSASFIAWSRSSCMPMLMKWVGVSARGRARRVFLCNVKVKVPVRHISSAVTQTSPSPCTPWPSPTEKFAPGTQTGKYSVEPAVSSLLSRLPP